MRLTIWTHWEGKSWEGEIPDRVEPHTPVGNKALLDLEYVFRWFNRVDDGDHERMLAVGYDLPSLSAGDKVKLVDLDTWYFCDYVGWMVSEAPPEGSRS
jgi:hypothetical protein